MKRFTLIMLVAMVPLLTIAQKRSKKDKAQKSSIASVEYMTIRGVEIPLDNELKRFPFSLAIFFIDPNPSK